jgi:excisionase family DNA binding protein
MTLAEVVEYLKIAPRTAYGWVKAGKLPGFKVGRRVEVRAGGYGEVGEGEGQGWQALRP